jgi:uncharacterized protein (TIGR03435 family)
MRVRGLFTIFGIMIISALVGAQSPAAPKPQPTERLTFEVASIKRNVSGDQGSQIRVQPGGQIVVTNNSLYNLIRNAYGTQRFEMVPGPKLPPWIDSDRWDIIAKPPADAPQREEQMQLRLRSLLEDRFKLDARREMREMPIYALTIARSDGQLGAQMKRSGDECAAAARARAAGEAASSAASRGLLRYSDEQRNRVDARRPAGQLCPESRRDDGPLRHRQDRADWAVRPRPAVDAGPGAWRWRRADRRYVTFCGDTGAAWAQTGGPARPGGGPGH